MKKKDKIVPIKPTPLKSDKKVAKPFIIESRWFVSEDDFSFRYGMRKLGWTEWSKSSAYKTESARDHAFDNLIKKKANGSLYWRITEYEYRKNTI